MLSEAVRSIGANISTTVAATMTVLIGMFLLGLVIAFATYARSWSDDVKSGLVGLTHKGNSYPDELSGGEQQRVSVARAFVNHPPLLVCDEPTGNLDPDTSVGIMQLLYRINRTGTTVVMATHDREMVDKMRKRVIALEAGRLVRDERRGGYTEE